MNRSKQVILKLRKLRNNENVPAKDAKDTQRWSALRAGYHAVAHSTTPGVLLSYTSVPRALICVKLDKLKKKLCKQLYKTI